MKPELATVQEIIALKQQISDLYDVLDKEVKTVYDEFGEGRFDYMVDSALEYPYLKFEIEDIVRKLQNGEDVWRSSNVKPLSFSSRALKNKPKGL